MYLPAVSLWEKGTGAEQFIPARKLPGTEDAAFVHQEKPAVLCYCSHISGFVRRDSIRVIYLPECVDIPQPVIQ